MAFILTGCPEKEELTYFYNYGAEPVYVTVTVDNQTDESVDFTGFFKNVLFYCKDEEITIEKKGGYIDLSNVTVEPHTKSNEEKIILMDEVQIQIFPVTILTSGQSEMISLVAEIKKNGVTQKITGFPVSEILSISNVKNNDYAGLENEDFAYTGFGYYYIDNSERDHPETYGTYICPDSRANGVKSGTINMIIIVKDDEIVVEYE